MRKCLVGILIGIALTISTSAFAEDVISLIGQKIQGEFPVKINGEELDKPAIVINGTSYLPNRSIADALGMDIKFDTDLGIELTKKESQTMTSETLTTTPEPTYDALYIDNRILVFSNLVYMFKANVETRPNDENVDEWKAELKKNQDELAIWEARKAALTQ